MSAPFSLPHLHAVPNEVIKIELRDADEVDAKITAPAWVLDGLLQEGVNMLYGQPKSGKTFVALDMAMHIALRQHWHGRRVEGGPVVYVAAEDALGVAQRRNAWRTYHGVSTHVPMAVYDQPIYLVQDRYVKGLIAAIQERGEKPALIVFDTLARCVPGVEENENGAMGLVIDNLERIRRETGAKAVLVIHHTGKSKDSVDPRGASSISAAMQGVLGLSGKIDEGVTLTVKNQRNGVGGDTVSLSFTHVGDTLVVDRGRERTWQPRATKSVRPRMTRDQVSDVLKAARKPLSPDEIAVRLRNPQAVRAVKSHLSRMLDGGVITLNEVGYSYAR